MNIDKKLNLVIPLTRDDGVVYVHSTPIAKAVFDFYFMVIAKTFTRIYAEHLSFAGGPRVCALMLKDTAQNTMRSDGSSTWWEGPDGVELGLLAEVRRLTNVLLPGQGGWQHVPYELAVKNGELTEDEVSEVENAITFFMVNSAMHRRSALQSILRSAAGLWGLETTSFTPLEYANSLMELMRAETTAEKETLLSIPS